jgi:hypothetical protein
VDDVLLEMNLPEGFRSGDRIELQFVSAQPRPSFILNTQPEPSREQVQLSPASRALDEVLKPIAGDRQSAPAPVRSPAPLLPAPSTDAPKVAAALSNALSLSGVFYESHQSQWVLGERPLQDLLREPQGKLSGASHNALASKAEPQLSPVEDKPRTTLTPAATNASTNLRPAEQASSPVHPDAIPQVRSQLQALEQQQLIWQGELWPGQEMEWTLQDPGEESRHGGQAQPWFTQLRLRLPQLGALTAELALVDRALRVRLTAPNAGAQEKMRTAHAALADALCAAGIELISFKVAADGGD